MMHMDQLISQTVLFFGRIGSEFFENIRLLQLSTWQIVIDILLVSVIFYWLFLFIRGSRTYHVILGILVLALGFLISKALSLVAVDWLLNRFLTMLLVAIPIIFQQELRQGLEKLGQTQRFMNHVSREANKIIQEITQASEHLAERKIGALIVFEGQTPLKEYIQTGVPLDAKISKELLISIFDRHSPLHDGAVIISNNLIRSAGSILQHSLKEYDHQFGTRHKAALSLSEGTDARIIVISEEKGSISWIQNAEMQTRVTPEQLRKLLEFIKPKKQ